MSELKKQLRCDAQKLIRACLAAAEPSAQLRAALQNFPRPAGRLYILALGKAAWHMARAALDILGSVDGGFVLTKYGHLQGPLPPLKCWEAGHPIPDEAGLAATEEILSWARETRAQDAVILLLSGGASALFEQPLIGLDELQDFNHQALASGASIQEINALRQCFSAVKGGKLAAALAPTAIWGYVLSDVLGDPLDLIASGPCTPPRVPLEDLAKIQKRYNFQLSAEALSCLRKRPRLRLPDVRMEILANVGTLVRAARDAARDLGYRPMILTDCMTGEAADWGRSLARELRRQRGSEALALISGGETVVHVQGGGKGGRNQELALAAVPGLAACPGLALFSLASDGTDGPTDAAGAYVDGGSLAALEAAGYAVEEVLADNNSYPALEAIGALVKTGPTGTNVNDLVMGLYRPAGP